MTPDYESAARRATEILIERHITATPILPLPILKSMPNVYVITFADQAVQSGLDRNDVVMTFGQDQDAATFVRNTDGAQFYTVVYNQILPFVMLQRALARELGHIALQHSGAKPVAVRTEEAKVFARHLLCPRALIKSVQDAGVPLTTEVIGNLTGCFERCIADMQKTPGCHVPAELNRKVREQFAPYVENYLHYQRYLMVNDQSSLANFGTFMDNYEE